MYQFSRSTKPTNLTLRYKNIYQLEPNWLVLHKIRTLGDFVKLMGKRATMKHRTV
jgi:hypothetical protein